MRHKDRVERITTIDGKQYKLSAVIDKTAEDIHHIIWLSKRHDWYDVQNPINKIKINRKKHIALNSFFWVNQSVHQQLKQCIEIWEPVLSKWVKNTLHELLSLPRESFYKDELVKSKYKWKPLFDGQLNKSLKLNV